jgi:O-antigen/teichoic acid export membrane protein
MVVGISLLARPVWIIFYKYNYIGIIILSLNVFVALFLNLFMITNFTLQSVNKFKMVYISVLGGFVTNAILDVPLMLLFSKIGIPPYFGAIVATMLGYSLSILTTMIYFKVKYNFHYRKTIMVCIKTMVPLVLMIITVLAIRYFMPVPTRKLSSIILCGVCGICGATIYLFTSYKMGILTEVFGKEYLNKIIKKLTFGKVSIKN